MTLDEASARFERIREMAADYEAAHAEEDKFRHDVLMAIMSGCDNAKMLASIAIATSAIRFPRYCA